MTIMQVVEESTGAVVRSAEFIVPTAAPRTTLTVDMDAVRRSQAIIVANASLWPGQLTAQQAGLLARIAVAYGLDPLLSELIPLGGKPYITLAGRMRIANNHPAFDGLECNPATEAEREAFRCEDDEDLWIARVHRADRVVPAVGYGRCSPRDKNPVGREWSQEMAQARAKNRALRDAFSVPLPSAEEHGGYRPSVIEAEAGAVAGAVPLLQIEEAIETQAPVPRNKAIHAALREAGLEDGDYRVLLREALGVDSSVELSEGQQDALIEALHALGDVKEAGAAEATVARLVADYRARLGQTDDADLEQIAIAPEEMASVEQVNIIHKLASPSALKDVDWKALTREQAAVWIQDLQPQRRPAKVR